MTLIRLEGISLAYGDQVLLDRVDLRIQAGERVCIVGRNGCGKSTLLRIITGQAEADDGEIWRNDTLRVSCLEQEVPACDDHSVYQVVAQGLGELGAVLDQYHQLLASGGDLDRLHELQQQIEVMDGWNLDRRIDTVISRLGLPAQKPLATCSGGIRRRALLAQALVSEPDLLLLDEPTNHMDISAITWLEGFLREFRGGLIFITHDRSFLRNLATRIVELDRGVLTSFDGDYGFFLRRKEEMLRAEEKAHARFDRKLSEYETWIRQGIKARRTRNQGKVRELLAMREQRAARRDRQGQVAMTLDDAEKSGKLVVDLRHVCIGFAGTPVIEDLSLRILRGDRIGIIGPNGCGKSTLLKLLLGELKPDSGQIVTGTRLETAWFDQQRDQLLADKTVRDNIAENSDFVDVRGKRRHVISYLKDFLFPPQRIDTPVRVLSGGERNRLLLAMLFTRPANLLVLDEPTNDLDVDTLELLEELLQDYEGTLLLVSHDRTFLDNVVTSIVAFEGDGQVREYVGGYEDWLRQRPGDDPFAWSRPRKEKKSAPAPQRRRTAGSAKLGYREKQELEALPDLIEALEAEQTELETLTCGADFYQQDKEAITEVLNRIESLRRDLRDAYQRWEELSARE